MGIGKEILKANGLYTKKDVERFEENNKELWDALNEAWSFMRTYGMAIKCQLQVKKEENPNDSSFDFLIACSEEILIAEEKTMETLRKCKRDF